LIGRIITFLGLDCLLSVGDHGCRTFNSEGLKQMGQEQLDILDGEGNKTDEVKSRPQVHEEELPHPVVDIWVYRQQGDVLLQQRAANKKIRPKHWGASAAGHVRAGENPLQEAIREIKEELGTEVAASKLEYVGKYKNKLKIPDTNRYDYEFAHTFLWRFEGGVKDFTPNEEVAQIKFFPLEEICADFNSDIPKRKYTPYGSYFDFVVAAVKKRLKSCG